jgi:uncharacterized cupin superfamily protein
MSPTNGPVIIPQPARMRSDRLSDAGAAKEPVGSPAPHFTRLGFDGPGLERFRFGVWETTAGKWRRDVVEAEFCFILSGTATFSLEDGRSWTFGANDAVFFPAHCNGVWDVSEPLRKAFVVIPS